MDQKPCALQSLIQLPLQVSTSRPKSRTERRIPSFPHPRKFKRIYTAQPNKPNPRLFTREVKFALPLAPSKHERAAPGPSADEATAAALGPCVDLALRLLENGRGHAVLITVGKRIVAERRAEAARVNNGPSTTGRPAAGIYEGDIDDMPVWVDRFLRQIREVGIPICVCENLSGYALTQRWRWGSDMAMYDCGNSAIVYIHKCVSVDIPPCDPGSLK
jgi:hypothetical protein